MMLQASSCDRPPEQAGEGLPAVLGVELVLFAGRDPGQIQAVALDLLVPLRLPGLEPGELVPGRLPLLAGPGLVPGHLISLPPARCAPARAGSIAGPDATAITKPGPRRPGNSPPRGPRGRFAGKPGVPLRR